MQYTKTETTIFLMKFWTQMKRVKEWQQYTTGSCPKIQDLSFYFLFFCLEQEGKLPHPFPIRLPKEEPQKNFPCRATKDQKLPPFLLLSPLFFTFFFYEKNMNSREKPKLPERKEKEIPQCLLFLSMSDSFLFSLLPNRQRTNHQPCPLHGLL